MLCLRTIWNNPLALVLESLLYQVSQAYQHEDLLTRTVYKQAKLGTLFTSSQTFSTDLLVHKALINRRMKETHHLCLKSQEYLLITVVCAISLSKKTKTGHLTEACVFERTERKKKSVFV